MLFHYHEWFGYSGALWYDTIVSKGYIWVEFFFALSALWLACMVGLGGSIVAGGLAWRFVERALGEAMRRRTLSALDQGRDR